LHGSLISDLKDINKNSKNHAVNKKLQSFVISLLQDPNEDAAKRSLNVMIELYKRRIWNDDKTVNAIWTGVVHSNPKVCASSCKFFLVLDYDYESDADASDFDSDKEDQLELLKNRKGS
jgi:protein SDA1